MGLYINPLDGTPKEKWLQDHSLVMQRFPDKFGATSAALWVCLVDNGAFTAAGVAYSAREQEAFNDPNDRRPKWWFLVPIPDLIEVGADPTTYLK